MKERVAQIQKHIKKNGETTLVELGELFPGVSSMTLRRDIERLENMGEVVRTKGGAKSVEYISRLKEELYSKRATENVEEKNIIAQKALGLIKEGSAIFLDSGTTLAALARIITDKKLFVITASPDIAVECSKNPGASVYMTGGYLNRDNLSLSGINALSFLDSINIDAAFMAASGFSLKNSFTCGNYDECRMKKKAVAKASKVVMLMDGSKIGRNLPFTFARLADVHCVVTDGKASEEFINEAVKNGIEVI